MLSIQILYAGLTYPSLLGKINANITIRYIKNGFRMSTVLVNSFTNNFSSHYCWVTGFLVAYKHELVSYNRKGVPEIAIFCSNVLSVYLIIVHVFKAFINSSATKLGAVIYRFHVHVRGQYLPSTLAPDN